VVPVAGHEARKPGTDRGSLGENIHGGLIMMVPALLKYGCHMTQQPYDHGGQKNYDYTFCHNESFPGK
jgi:hypothetical protein